MKPQSISVVAFPYALKLVGDPKKTSYEEWTKSLEQVKDCERGSGIFSLGNMKLVIAENPTEAATRLCAIVGQNLKSWGFTPSNFRFRVSFSQIEDGRFWSSMASNDGIEYTPTAPN